MNQPTDPAAQTLLLEEDIDSFLLAALYSIKLALAPYWYLTSVLFLVAVNRVSICLRRLT
jgi:hypothetical protein